MNLVSGYRATTGLDVYAVAALRTSAAVSVLRRHLRRPLSCSRCLVRRRV